VFSDSHRKNAVMKAVLEKTNKSIDAVAHLGDGSNEIHHLMLEYPSIPLYVVAGNCDSGSGQNTLAFNFASKKIILTHGHKFHVKSGYLRISLWAEENEADVCLFGHTHEPAIFYSGRTLMMNPGSISFPKSEYPVSYGVVDVDENGIVVGSVIAKYSWGFKKVL